MRIRPGSVFDGAYHIERIIFRSSDSAPPFSRPARIIYEASHVRFFQKFAIKMLEDTESSSAEWRIRFRRQAEILACLNHSSIVKIYEYGTTKGKIPYIVFEFLDGRSLRNRLNGARIPIRETARILLPIASALDHMHEQNFAHCHVKPDHIILLGNHSSKLIGLGLAEIVQPSTVRKGHITGTLQYISPEQIRGENVTGRSDQFALGAVAYEMLAGIRAFSASTAGGIIAQIFNSEPPRISGVGECVHAVISRAISKAPHARFSTVTEFVEALLGAASSNEESLPAIGRIGPDVYRPRRLSVFLSYGRPDEAIACSINKTLQEAGVRTFLFKDHALPGAKLHHLMRDGVNAHDRVMLLCSKDSLERKGVVSEIEEALEREAREGGEPILIPVALDDYVFEDWAPHRAGVAQAIRDRVIADFRGVLTSPERYDRAIKRVLEALTVAEPESS